MALETSAAALMHLQHPRLAVLLGEGGALENAITALRGHSGAPSPALIVGDDRLRPVSSALELPIVATLADAARMLGERAKGAFIGVAGSLGPRAAALTVLGEAAELGWRIHHVETAEGEARWRPWDLTDVLGGGADPRLDDSIRALITGRRILVTGAGGSIGSALCRKIAALDPAWIGLLDYSEFNLFRIDYELQSAFPAVPRAARLCDVRDGEAIARCFERDRPDLVFHVAALKHVPLLESHASEGVVTNVAGTRNVARAVRDIGAHMVFVSTDKAVNPANVMGSTKRLGELLCQAYDRAGPRRFVTVRLGNVLGSAGSVSPLFAAQIAAGGPVTVTHRSVMRYFITIPQTASFLLRAAALGLERADLRGVVHLLEMGEPMAVVDLARTMIRLAGRRPDQDVPITFVGLRPGEKLTEQLIGDEEWVEGAMSADVTAVASPPRLLPALESDVDRLVSLARAGRDDLVRAALSRALAPHGIAQPARSAVAV